MYLLGLLGELPYPASVLFLFLLSLFCHKTMPGQLHSVFLHSSALIDNMMAHGKSRVLVTPAVSTVLGTCPQKRPAKSSTASKRASRSKWARTTAALTVTQELAHLIPKVTNPSQLEWVPLASAQPVRQSTPLPDIVPIISGAVIEGLKATGLFSDAPTDYSPEDSNQAASIQESVAALIQDIVGEQNSPSVNQSNSYVTARNVSCCMQSTGRGYGPAQACA